MIRNGTIVDDIREVKTGQWNILVPLDFYNRMIGLGVPHNQTGFMFLTYSISTTGLKEAMVCDRILKKFAEIWGL